MNSAKEMVLTGLDVSTREAKERGLITMVCKRDELEALTRKVARRMALMPRGMQRMHKSYMNRVHETMGFWKANKDYLEILAILGTQVAPEYARFSETTIKRGLKAALQEANAPFDELERSFASGQDPD